MSASVLSVLLPPTRIHRSGAILRKRARIVLQRVHFVASRLAIFAALPRTMDRSSAKLGEGAKRLFKGLLAVFRVGKVS